MSNTSIAAYPESKGQACVDFIRMHHPQWRVVLNPDKFDPDASVQVLENQMATVVWLTFPQIEDWNLYSGIATFLKCSWLRVLFLEHIVWEYNLYDDQNALIDRFEPLPRIWEHESGPVGSAEVVAQLWKINPARIKKYLKPWNDRLKKRKAYFCRDEFRYGQFEQGFDFLKAVTGLSFPA